MRVTICRDPRSVKSGRTGALPRDQSRAKENARAAPGRRSERVLEIL